MCKDKKLHHILWLAYVCSCMHIINTAQKKMDFPSPSTEAVVVICFTLAFESNIWNSTVVQWNILFQVFTSFLAPAKRVCSFHTANLFYFYSMTFVSFFYNQTFKSRTRFKGCVCYIFTSLFFTSKREH